MTYLPVILVGMLLILVMAALSYLAGRYLNLTADQLTRRVSILEQEMAGLCNEVRALKDRRGHSYATNDGLEDAIAVAIDVIQEYDASRRYTVARIQQLQQILGQVRSDPHGYREGENKKIPYERRNPRAREEGKL